MNELVVKCACDTNNRVDLAKLTERKAVCGRCGNTLSLPATPLTITDANFTEEVERSPVPFLLDLWAAWCAPCRALAPTIDELAFEFQGKAGIGKLDVEANQETAARLRAGSIPLLLIFKNGQVVDRLIGAHPKQVIARQLKAHL